MALPNWNAPIPFQAIVPDPGDGTGSSKPDLSEPADSAKRMTRALKTLLSSGGTLTKAKYLNETDIPLILNAFNIYAAGRVNGAWSYVSPYMLDVPRDAPDDFPWNRYIPDGVINTWDGNLYRDLTGAWSPLTGQADRSDPQLGRYRLIIFIHRHMLGTAHETAKVVTDRIYSVTCYDRDSQMAHWFDPWPYDRVERENDMRRFWENVEHGWTDNGQVIQFDQFNTVQYDALDLVQGIWHRHMEPCFTQFSMLGIIIALIRSAPVEPAVEPEDEPDVEPEVEPLVPDDTVEMLSGMGREFIPRLIRFLIRTIRENPDSVDPRLTGHDPATQAYWAENFSIRNNMYLRDVVYYYLVGIYPPGAPSHWLADTVCPVV
ncbi:hypothetical protein F4775DRAFT_592998 [Biscogniauxia sp. FL1348]|nr:hypothetical protein F4775DRAFT_592998 [Biscogniauxia sp. FL1348]